MRIHLFLVICLIFSKLSAQDIPIFEPDSIKKQIRPLAISRDFRTDGLLNEPEWQQAQTAGDFTQMEPFQGLPSRHRTEVKLLYSPKYVYVGVFCGDSLGKKGLRIPSLARDFDTDSRDSFSILFDSFNDQRNAMGFITDPYGTQSDYLSFDDTIFDGDWDGLWRVRTARTDSGWTAEMAIPWQMFRFPKNTQNPVWGLQFARMRRATNEASVWSRVPRAFSEARMNYAGQLTGFTPPKQSATNIRVQPYTLFANDNYRGTEFTEPSGRNLKIGGEIKWVLNANTVLDLTANTDFAQADADRQVNNLTRFGVFFPERRQFFLENAGLFGIGLAPLDNFWGGQMIVQPFFSRQIGLDSQGLPIPIDGGARIVSRNAKRNYGAILMRQRGNDTTPATNFFVGRFSENFGEQNRVGGLITMKNNADGTNTTASVDGFFRLTQTVTLTTMAMASMSSGGRDRGVSAFYQLTKRSNQWIWWLNQALVTRNFNPEMGFVSRSDVLETTPGFYWLSRGKYLPKWIRSFEPGGFMLTYHSATTGRLVEQQTNLNPVWFSFQSGGGFGYFVDKFYQRLDEPFEPIDIRIGKGEYRYFRHRLVGFSDRSKKFGHFTNLDFGGYYNGKLRTFNTELFFSPIPQARFAFSYERNDFSGVGETKTDASVSLYSIQTRLALNPRVQLIGFYQRNSVDRRDILNVRFSWEYRPLSFLFLVLNRREFNGFDRTRQRENHEIAKLSYLRQF